MDGKSGIEILGYQDAESAFRKSGNLYHPSGSTDTASCLADQYKSADSSREQQRLKQAEIPLKLSRWE